MIFATATQLAALTGLCDTVMLGLCGASHLSHGATY